MKKYIIKQTGQEIKVGQRIIIKGIQNTSFGQLRYYENTVATKEFINELIKKKLVSVVEHKDTKDLTFYVGLLAQKMHKDVDEVILMLDDMNKVCSRAVLDLLLDTIAQAFYNDDPKAFDEAEHYYSIRLYDGKCGEVLRVHSRIPLFKSVEDVEAARRILKQQLIYMYGEQ